MEKPIKTIPRSEYYNANKRNFIRAVLLLAYFFDESKAGINQEEGQERGKN